MSETEITPKFLNTTTTYNYMYKYQLPYHYV